MSQMKDVTALNSEGRTERKRKPFMERSELPHLHLQMEGQDRPIYHERA